MTPPPYGSPQYGPPGAAPSNDRTTLWGVLGIVLALCCWPLGLLFGALSLTEAKKAGKPPTLAYVAFGISAVSVVISIISVATGAFSGFMPTAP